ncbi:reverse transcriptase-like protein [candidate division WS5 bacterium]|uniref:Reverse transcriptase-like protein n=1 Tax=candidate division WS5 bacterium TaxID=2093353 RepID=A0A419DG74_9BACT|nr:MAG: reverse transcriptase-like protein [candidate division WS5 bacterium]
MNKITIYTDGGARNNPGPAGIGVVLYDENKKIIETYKEYIGEATNNQAEYKALIKGLELAEKYIDSRRSLSAKEIPASAGMTKEGGNDPATLKLRGASKGVEINCFLDSELVVKQLNKEYKVKDPGIKELYNQVLDLAMFKNISFSHVRREQNKLADKLVNEAIDER